MSSRSQILLSVSDLQISFASPQAFVAVDKVSFQLHQGKTLAIVGESGSGKSLIALSVMGLQSPDAQLKGSICLHTDEKKIRTDTLQVRDWKKLRGKAIAMIFQEPMSALNPTMKVGTQLCECIRQHQAIHNRKAKKQALEWMSRVQLPDPEGMFYRYPHQLSGGQKQRIMIAMAMCNQPQLLIADEPTTALDSSVQKDIIDLMHRLREETGTAMIFITHDLALAKNVADDILVMQKGVVQEYGTAQQVFSMPSAMYTRALLACRPKAENKGRSLPVVQDILQGKTTEKTYSPSPTDTICLSVNDLCVYYKERTNAGLFRSKTYFKAVEHISFRIKKGETLGLAGESGCGKSTIGKALMGLVPIHTGKIETAGLTIEGGSFNQWKLIRKKMQLVFQDPFASLNPRHTISEILSEPLYLHSGRKVISGQVERLLDLVQLPRNATGKYPHQFSGGQRQRIGIARALAVQPEILICDESVSALDISVQAQILNLLKELQSELQLAYLFISHDLAVVYHMADHILVMQKGKMEEIGKAEDIFLHPQTLYTQRLLAAMPDA